MEIEFQSGIDFARKMDQSDPLRDYRKQFHIPKRYSEEEVIYLCGNSLGLQPKNAEQLVNDEIEAWKNRGVDGHFKASRPWYFYPREIVAYSCDIVGGSESEIAIMNGLTVNLHLMMISFYRPEKNRRKILMEHKAFPSDIYAVESQARFHGFDPEDVIITVKPRDGEYFIRNEDILETIDRHGEEIALVLIGGVNYFTGQLFDIPAITAKAHEHGCYAGFDLAHAVGNVELKLHDWDVDFAAWCTYKYLNSGPGSISGVFVHERHGGNPMLKRLAGWWGNDPETRFLMEPEFVPYSGASGWQLSNPPILAMAPMIASHAMFRLVGMKAIRQKSVALTGYLEFLLDNSGVDMKIITPRDPNQRGCQLSIMTDDMPDERVKQLQHNGVIVDYRKPGVIRAAPVPLYNSFTEVYKFVELFKSLKPS